MTIKTISIPLCLVMAFTAGNVSAAETTDDALFETPYNGIISGTAASVSIDAVNPGDGIKGVIGTFTINSDNFGQITGQALVEDTQSVVPSGTCPDDTDSELTLGAISGAHRFPNGDLLYLNGLTRTACIDFDTLTVIAHESGKFTGGTGQFAHATGTWDITDDVKLWSVDQAGQLFGSFSGKIKGTIFTLAPIHPGRGKSRN